MPTAMPPDPLASRLASSISLSISIANGVSRASVYLIAAGGSLPGEPKLPWPSTSG
ncbi:Uncharacterised protein [Mycobacterium tuberculosis]|nr:Uncharacterised protein [Mycobacterium tuberculosis]